MTIQNSTQYANQIAIPPVIMEANVFLGKLRVIKYNFTQATGTGSIGSTARLVKLPAGKVMLCAGQSQCKVAGLTTAATIDLGYAAYMNQDGVTVTADVDAITDGQAVLAAGTTFIPGAALADGTLTFTSRAGVVLIATTGGATMPVAATIQGTWVFAIE